MRRLILALLALATVTPAWAQDDQRPPPSPQMQADRAHLHEACAADMEHFCPDASQDRRARRDCMVANQSKFTKPCQDAVGEMEARRAARRADQAQHDPQ